MPSPLPDPARARPPAEPSWRAMVRRLLVYARSLGAPLEEAEDLVHDAVTKVIRDPDWHDPARGSLLTALRVVVRSRWLNHRRGDGVRSRAQPTLLHLIRTDAPTPGAPLGHAEARTNRQRLLALLEPEEREVFATWLRQRARELDGPAAAAHLGLDPAAYEAAKKRLRRRCAALLDELGLSPADLFDPPEAS